jgi:hypothetical protein
LIGKQPIVRVQAHVGASLHGLGQEVRTEPARERRRNRLLEEDPDMPAATRSRSFQRGVEIEALTDLQKGRRVVPPVRLIEVGGEDVAGFIQEQRVDASDERLAVFVLA